MGQLKTARISAHDLEVKAKGKARTVRKRNFKESYNKLCIDPLVPKERNLLPSQLSRDNGQRTEDRVAACLDAAEEILGKFASASSELCHCSQYQ